MKCEFCEEHYDDRDNSLGYGDTKCPHCGRINFSEPDRLETEETEVKPDNSCEALMVMDGVDIREYVLYNTRLGQSEGRRKMTPEVAAELNEERESEGQEGRWVESAYLDASKGK
jgi:phage FluMu protein Com